MRGLLGIFLLSFAILTGRAGAETVVPVGSGSKGSDRAIILVHGLLGSPRGSFTSAKGVFWPDLVRKDEEDEPHSGKLSSFAVYSLDYESAFNGISSVPDIADTLARALTDEGIFLRHHYVYFVAHSLGGIIAKQLVLTLTTRYSVLRDRIVGVALLGVPSSGAPLADLATSVDAESVAEYFGWNGKLLEDLQSNSSYLSSLDSSLRNYRRASGYHAMIACAVEGQAEDLNTIVAKNSPWYVKAWRSIVPVSSATGFNTIVPKIYSQQDCDQGPDTILEASHITLPKPNGPGANIHIWLRARINDAFGNYKMSHSNSIHIETVLDLSATLDRIHQLHHVYDQNTFPLSFEEVIYDPRSASDLRRFQLKKAPVDAYSVERLFDIIHDENPCIVVTHQSSNGDRYEVALNGAQQDRQGHVSCRE